MASFTDIEPLLKLVEEGRWALQVRQSYGVVLSFKPSQAMPAFYDGSTCTLDQSMSAAKLASYFTHEMYHAELQNLGQSSDIDSLTQQEYSDEMVMEEYIANIQQYQFFVTLDVVHGKLPRNPSEAITPPRYAQYRSAYDAGLVKAAQAKIAQGDRHAFAMVNANRLLRIFTVERGLGVGGLSYREFYIKQWRDNARKKGAKS